MRFLTAVTDSNTRAEQEVSALRAKGFNAEIFRKSESLELGHLGKEEEARRALSAYLEALPRGYLLIGVYCDDRDFEKVAAHFEASEHLSDPSHFVEQKNIDSSHAWAQKVRVKTGEWRRRKGARKHAVHVETRDDIHHAHEGEMPGARTGHGGSLFEDLEREFELHFRDHLAPKTSSYGAYRIAYRLGIQLAANRIYRDRSWEEIQSRAKKVWERQSNVPKWKYAKEAVRFGFQKARLFQSPESPETRA